MSPEERQNPSPESPAGEAPSNTLPKAYDPSVIEQKWANYWVDERLFEVPEPAAKAADDSSQTFTLLLPPPNVTGRLHMGHMLNQTEMDILTRWHRMRGERVLWVPGTDHAGIATQMMVERQLTSEGTDRKALGREAFTERVWEWKRQYGSAITEQMKRLGASVDWSREYFTMDENLSTAVIEAFVRLYEQGLIYRGAYIVNWDPQIQTAVSDLEVENEERIGKLYQIRYPFADGTGSIVIATTRPETMLGDVAVAVNPQDDRYRGFIGKLLTLPLSGVSGGRDREIPIIADDWANPEFGTGAVKVTPAHDPNDFAIGQRHNLPSLTILDPTARVDLPGSPFHGKDRYEAREMIVAQLTEAGLLVSVKDHPMTVPVSQRTGAVIEPRLSMQWFIAVNKQPTKPGAPGLDSEIWESGPRSKSIAQNAIDAVRDGHIKFTPAMYSKTYFEWMSNIHDWCISRQLWWGHRIPAWHCAGCKAITVARTAPSACTTCGSAELVQETDVLDTWFSSGLLPFTVFGWPETGNGERRTENVNPDLATFYPTSLLVTGFDILFFWVARMIMLGCHFMLDVPMPDGSPRALADAVPFKAVYIHALVRDANREKMSKTKGNVIDPIEIVQKYGTDAVRFTLASMASPGTDIAFSEARTEGNRAFANKIWNAARFLFMNLDRAREAGIEIDFTKISTSLRPYDNWSDDPNLPGLDHVPFIEHPYYPLEARWIISRLSQAANDVHGALERYRFDEAANHIYQFFWGDFCDWYLEIVKLHLNFGNNDDKRATASSLTILTGVFESALRLLSPFMPFITEEIWQALYNGVPPASSIALCSYPESSDYPADILSNITKMEAMQELVIAIRGLRKDMGVPDKDLVGIRIRGTPYIGFLEDNSEILPRLARLKTIEYVAQSLSGVDCRSTTHFDVQILYERQIDIPAERERLTKELAKLEKGLAAAERQLSNEAFMAKAPAPIVEGLRKQADETKLLYDKTKSALDALNGSNP